MKTKMLKLLITSAVSILILSGCAGQNAIRLTDEQRAKIKTVSLDNNVVKPKTAFYQGRAQSVGLAFGVLGALATSGSAQDTGTQLAEFMLKNNIDIGEITNTALAAETKRTNTFLVTNAGNEDAKFKSEIKIFGLAQSNGLSSTLYPTLGVTSQLIDKNGVVTWEKYEYVTALNSENNQGDTLENFQKDPQKLKSTFENAARIVTKLLVENLNGK